MNARLSRLAIWALAIAAVSGSALAQGRPAIQAPPATQAAPRLSSETKGFQECISHGCKLVPEVKQIKKTVYEVHEVPFCVKKLPPLLSLLHHRGCDCEMCAECQCPRYKKVLVKKEVVCKEICTTKCVVEEHGEIVPCQKFP